MSERAARQSLRAFLTRLVRGGLIRRGIRRQRRPAQPHDHYDDIDVGLEKLEVAGQLP